MTKILIILIFGLLCEAVGVVYLKKGLKEIGGVQRISVSEIARVVKVGATNSDMWIGLFFDATFFLTLLIVMSKGTLSFVWPLTSLSFVFTTIAAKLYLHEQVSALRWGGVLLIMLGAGVITYTEKVVDAKPPATSTAQSSSASQ